MRHTLLVMSLVAAVGLAGCAKDIGDIVRELGHGELAPPATLLKPGTVVVVESARPFKARIICNQQALLGSNFDPSALDTSGTISQKWTKKSSAKLGLKADEVSTINGSLGFKYVQDVAIKLSNARFFELNDALLADRVKAGSISEGCVDVMNLRLEENQPITVLRSVLEADVEYTVTWDASLSGELDELKTSVLQDIAPLITAAYTTEGSNRILGKALFWGVKDDTFFVNVIANYADIFPQDAVGKTASDVAPVRSLLTQKDSIEILPAKD